MPGSPGNRKRPPCQYTSGRFVCCPVFPKPRRCEVHKSRHSRPNTMVATLPANSPGTRAAARGRDRPPLRPAGTFPGSGRAFLYVGRSRRSFGRCQIEKIGLPPCPNRIFPVSRRPYMWLCQDVSRPGASVGLGIGRCSAAPFFLYRGRIEVPGATTPFLCLRQLDTPASWGCFQVGPSMGFPAAHGVSRD